MSHLASKSLLIAALAAATLLPATASEARNFPARSGSSAYPADATCWTPYGGSVSNSCATARYWYLPIIFDATNLFGSLGAWVIVEGQFPSNNVSCRMTASNATNTAFAFSDNSNLTAQMPVFGSPYTRTYSVYVPGGDSGVVSVDCLVNPGGRVHVAATM